MRMVIMDVSPAMAEEWLTHVPPEQRALRPTNVDRIKRDIQGGNYHLHHQGIAWDTKGRLIDGQHRLHAIIEAGVTITVAVFYDVPWESYPYLDGILRRTPTDQFRAGGVVDITADKIAVARMLEYGDDAVANQIGRTPSELVFLVHKHMTIIRWVFGHTAQRVKYVTTAPVLAAVGLAAYWERDRRVLEDFLRILVTGIAEDPKRDTVVIRYRDALRNYTVRDMSGRIICLLRTQRVLKAYMTHQDLWPIYTPSQLFWPTPSAKIAAEQ
jgi:hypothetical protein